MADGDRLLCVRNSWGSNWGHNGLGWIADTTESKLPGCTNVILYYGSSTYDKSQMARLIDNIVQDCKAVGIETATPAEIDAGIAALGRVVREALVTRSA